MPVQYGGLSKEGEQEFTTANPAIEEIIKPTSKHTIEFPISEVGDPLLFVPNELHFFTHRISIMSSAIFILVMLYLGKLSGQCVDICSDNVHCKT